MSAQELALVVTALVPLVTAMGVAVRRCGTHTPLVLDPGGVDVQADELDRSVKSGR